MRVSFDTNIALYALAEISNPSKTAKARRLLEELQISGQGVISTQVLKEFANVCTKKLRPHVPRASLTIYIEVLSAFELIAVDTELIERAIARHYDSKISFYDSLHIESAILGGAEVLYSEDMQHGMHFGSLNVINPLL